MVVDVDPGACDVAGRLLALLGYETWTARGAAEALGLLHLETDFNLLVIDVIMPGMSGRQLAAIAACLRPGVPVLFTSGGLHQDLVDQGMLPSNAPFLPKLFTPEDLLEADPTLSDPHASTRRDKPLTGRHRPNDLSVFSKPSL